MNGNRIMKFLFHFTGILLFFLPIVSSEAQVYDAGRLRLTADIWGEVYLFHPDVIRADKKVQWEQALVSFLPFIKEKIPEDQFMQLINKRLLGILNDRFTRVQPRGEKIPVQCLLPSCKEFDYIRFDESQLSDIGYLKVVDTLITDRNSLRPLFVDVRIGSQLHTDYHIRTFFDYFISWFLTEPVALSQRVSREHFGWDEWNDWWFYEQRWKICETDRQQAGGNILQPFHAYKEELSPFLPDFDFTDFVPLKRPIYLITNNSFLSYYKNLIGNLAAQKSGVYVIQEDSGLVFTPANSGLIGYPLSPTYDFILNTSFYVTNGQLMMPFYREYDKIDRVVLEKSLLVDFSPDKSVPMSLAIFPKRYESASPTLSVEEKMLGLMKIRTVLKYFYRDNSLYAGYLEEAFDKYVRLAQATLTDQAYYELIQEMLAPLNDSHISVFHPSLVDFSAMYVAPVTFEWIENRMVVTGVGEGITECRPGDVISAVDGTPVAGLLEAGRKRISHSNRQGLLATVIHPGNFAGEKGSPILLNIDGKKIILSRSVSIWELATSCGKKESGIYEGNIGYLNLSFNYTAADIQAELKKMYATRGLIIDLRSSYPTYDFDKFLRMLCLQPVVTRISEVPVVSAGGDEGICVQKNRCSPEPGFTYKGKIAVLIDKTMVSRPEDIAIALSAFPQVIFIGEQTQGTDGEVAKIHLPGNGEISFTGQRIKFGNGKDFQRIGILPDIPVEKTIRGAKQCRDEILERAFSYMGSK